MFRTRTLFQVVQKVRPRPVEDRPTDSSIRRYRLGAHRESLSLGCCATTGLRGIEVHPNPRPVLLDLYRKTLSDLATHIPEHAVYRQATTAITQHRLNVVEQTEDVAKIEEALNAGQIEEIIIAAEDELKLIPKMAEWKA
ncbi:hypothetical protein IWQ60_000499 [Tieghemiomyces parasiticus]|uniref:Uncharacterized protein n=1 Tax=Tieghemiomyces parasiticus TaxID=78921 RepID=A0A9W8AM33_9FUNG|nr:hypothetical protein IWQ60_000499 [Tieghemiomyces parasiticus]